MAAVLKVKDGGSWRTVVEPYIKVDDTWKTVHNIWIKHGGTWRLSHKTAVGRYNEGSATTYGNSGSYTVPAGVRYLQVTVIGGGGKGAGGVKTGPIAGVYDHYTCPGGSFSTSSTSTSATGGAGGHGGLVDCTFEVIPGETYTWSGGSGATSGGGLGTDMTLAPHIGYGSQTAVSTSSSSSIGSAGGSLTFSGGSATIVAGGGIGGAVGVVTVTSSCSTTIFSTAYYGYVVTATNPGRSGTNSNSISATNLISTLVNGTASSGGGVGGSGNAAGTNGSNGSVEIIPYGKN